MKVKVLQTGRWAIDCRTQIAFYQDEIIEVPESVGNDMIKAGWAVSFEQKAQMKADENKMMGVAEENKADISVGDNVEVLDGKNKGAEGEVVKVDNKPDDTLVKQLKNMDKNGLVAFAKENEIDIDARESKDKILKAILKFIKG